jgi:tetratricopeptide (TPR) repeat protein
MKRRFASVLVVLFLVASGELCAQDADARLGRASFANSGNGSAQEPFLRGVLLLHSFEYADAATAFREAQAADSNFAMAYWGEAMTYNHPLWFQHDRDAAVEALNRLAPAREERLATAGTDRERDFLDAAETLYGEGDLYERNRAYRDAMRRMYELYPEDDEVATFYALSILGTSEDGRDFATYMKAASIADVVFRRNPDHPGAAHYLIHSFDDPIHAPLGLRAARAYSQIAPGASHALHMPTHIFVALGMWEDVAEMNVRSWQASVDRAKRLDLSSSAYSYHSIHWELYARTQMGQFEKARDLARRVRSLYEEGGGRGVHYYLARMVATYISESEDWAFASEESPVDVDELELGTAAMYRFGLGLASIRTGSVDGAEAAVRDIRGWRTEEAAREEEVDDASMGQYRQGLEVAIVLEHELEALIEQARGNTDRAIEILLRARDIETAMSFDYGPPSIVKPSAELLGEMLLASGKSAESVEAFDLALERAPGRSLSLEGLAEAAAAAGLEKRAAEAAALLADNKRNADKTRDLVPIGATRN